MFALAKAGRDYAYMPKVRLVHQGLCVLARMPPTMLVMFDDVLLPLSFFGDSFPWPGFLGAHSSPAMCKPGAMRGQIIALRSFCDTLGNVTHALGHFWSFGVVYVESHCDSWNDLSLAFDLISQPSRRGRGVRFYLSAMFQ